MCRVATSEVTQKPSQSSYVSKSNNNNTWVKFSPPKSTAHSIKVELSSHSFATTHTAPHLVNSISKAIAKEIMQEVALLCRKETSIKAFKHWYHISWLTLQISSKLAIQWSFIGKAHLQESSIRLAPFMKTLRTRQCLPRGSLVWLSTYPKALMIATKSTTKILTMHRKRKSSRCTNLDF